MQTSSTKLLTIELTEAEARALRNEIMENVLTDCKSLHALADDLARELDVEHAHPLAGPVARRVEHRRNGHPPKPARAGKTVTCEHCGAEMKPQGIGIHMARKHPGMEITATSAA